MISHFEVKAGQYYWIDRDAYKLYLKRNTIYPQKMKWIPLIVRIDGEPFFRDDINIWKVRCTWMRGGFHPDPYNPTIPIEYLVREYKPNV